MNYDIQKLELRAGQDSVSGHSQDMWQQGSGLKTCSFSYKVSKMKKNWAISHPSMLDGLHRWAPGYPGTQLMVLTSGS